MQGLLAKTVKPPLLAGSQTAAGMCIGLGNRRLQSSRFDPKRRFGRFWRNSK
jgi:hypothetical protein